MNASAHPGVYCTQEEMRTAAREFVASLGQANALLLERNLKYTRAACDALRMLKQALAEDERLTPEERRAL